MKYYAIINKEQVGPMELPELVQAGLRPDTYVWCKGMDDWDEAKNVADICRFFRNRLFDLMHPSQAPQEVVAEEVGADTPPPYMADEDYKGMKRREFYDTVGQQIAQQNEVREAAEAEEQNRTEPVLPPVWMLVLAFICFFPLAIPALIMRSKSQQAWKGGDAPTAHEAARLAKMYSGIAICLGVICLGLLIRFV